MRPAATLAEQAQVRELAVVVDGPHAGRWYWRDDLEAMARSAERMGHPLDAAARRVTRAGTGNVIRQIGNTDGHGLGDSRRCETDHGRASLASAGTRPVSIQARPPEVALGSGV